VYEPYLMQIGFLERTPRGRSVTARAIEYMGKSGGGRTQGRLFDRP
jgi:Holliday junction DNA helicase RuvB